ncbi:MAG: NUDIX hydrolase [Candidatus Nanohaloarchaea archaeon]
MSKDVIECATAVTYNPETGKYLLVQRAEHDSNPGKWEFPGGGIDEGEAPKEAALRELKEEAGLTGKIKDKAGSKLVVYGNRDFEMHQFLVEVEGNAVKLSREHQDYEWIEPEEVHGFDIVEGIKDDFQTFGVDL